MTKEKKHMSMKELPVKLQPCERMKSLGVHALSDEELLSVILRSGNANRRVSEIARAVITLCEEYGGLSHLGLISFESLCLIDGVGEVKALQLLAVAELSRRIGVNRSLSDINIIIRPEDAADYLMKNLSGLDHEETWVLYLDGKGGLIKSLCLSKGTINSSLFSARDIFKEALGCQAVSFILAHNHPSGDTKPSQEDINVTRSLVKASLFMDITFLDHIIIGDHVFSSLKQKGFM